MFKPCSIIVLFAVLVTVNLCNAVYADSASFEYSQYQTGYSQALSIEVGQSLLVDESRVIYIVAHPYSRVPDVSLHFENVTGFDELIPSQPSYVSIDTSSHALGLVQSGIDSEKQYYRTEFESYQPTQAITSPIRLSRAMDNPVLDSNQCTRTMTVTIDVPEGGLAGYNTIHGNLLTQWDLPEGLAYTINSHTQPAEFWISSDGSLFQNQQRDWGTFTGQLTFTAEVEFSRSGAMNQANAGDLLFQPNSRIHFANAQHISTVGKSATLPAGNVTVTSSQQYQWHKKSESNGLELQFSTIADPINQPQSVDQMELIVFKTLTPTGETAYSLDAGVKGTNIVAATLTTPGAAGKTYAFMESEFESDDTTKEAYFEYFADSLQGLIDAGFTNGQYTIALTDAQGNVNEHTVDLAGQFVEMPVTEQQILTTDTQPTIQWQVPSGDVALVVIGLENEQYESFIPMSASEHDLQTETSWTPDTNLDQAGYELFVAFGDENFVFTESLITGYVTEAGGLLNVMETPGDINRDGLINGFDVDPFVDVLLNGPYTPIADMNLDGQVNGFDVDLFVNALLGNNSTPQPTDIPEPATALLLAGLVFILQKRRDSL